MLTFTLAWSFCLGLFFEYSRNPLSFWKQYTKFIYPPTIDQRIWNIDKCQIHNKENPSS